MGVDQNGIYTPDVSVNQGPLGGLMQILNAGTAGQNTARTQQERDLQLQLEQTKALQAQHDYQRRLGYENTIANMDPNASPQQFLNKAAPYMDPTSAVSSAIINAPYRYAMGQGRLLAGQGAADTGTANLQKAGTAASIAPATIDQKTADAEKLRAEAALADARTKAVPFFADAAKSNAASKAVIARAREDAVNKAPNAGKSINAAEARVTAQAALIASKEKDLTLMAAQITDPAHKKALEEGLTAMKQELAIRQQELDAARSAAQTPASSQASGSSAGPTPAGTLSTVQKMQSLLGSSKPPGQ